MTQTEYRLNDSKIVLGHTFDDMVEILSAIEKSVGGFFGPGMAFNDCRVMTTVTPIEDWLAYDKNFICYYRNASPSHHPLTDASINKRWTLTLRFRKTCSEQFDFEYEFNLTNRYDKVIGTEKCRLVRDAIHLESTVGESIVASEINALFEHIIEAKRQTANLTSWANSNLDMFIYCKACHHTGTVKADQISTVFQNCDNIEQSCEKLRCTNCKILGRVKLWPNLSKPIKLGQ